MKTLKISTLMAALTSLVLMAASLSFADSGFKTALQSCAAKNDVTLGQGQVSPVAHQAMQECMREAGYTQPRHHRHHWKKIKACVETEKGVTLPAFQPGQPRPTLTAAQKGAIQACRAEFKAKRKASAATSSSTQ